MHVIVSFFLDFCFLKDSDMMSKWNGEEDFNRKVYDIVYT